MFWVLLGEHGPASPGQAVLAGRRRHQPRVEQVLAERLETAGLAVLAQHAGVEVLQQRGVSGRDGQVGPQRGFRLVRLVTRVR